MTVHRRRALQVAGTAGLTALAGCSAIADLFSSDRYEYALTAEPVGQSLVEYALYDPESAAPYQAGAREALDAVLPDGRHATRGFEPVPPRSYVEHEGRYYRTATVVTGRERTERTLVRASRLEPGEATDPTPVDSLPAASRRVIEVLHDYGATGDGSGGDLLYGDAYVLRRPAELNGPVADDLDGAAVALDGSGYATYRLSLATETIPEPVHETFAVEVAADAAAFREVVLATRTDAELTRTDLEPDVGDLLETVLHGETYRETTPLSPRYARLIDRLGLAGVDVERTGQLLWYDGSLYRYGLFVTAAN